MGHLQSVTTSGNRSHWVAYAPLVGRVEWDAETTEDRPNELIAWQSLPGSTVNTSGQVRFRPATGKRGTVVELSMNYDPPGGAVGAAAAWMFGQSGEQQVEEDLRRFKAIMETGEIASTEGQPSGRGREAFPQTGVMILEQRVARGLGYFSLGLGAAEVLLPGPLGRAIGAGEGRGLLPILGVREIATGVGILSGKRPAGWLWGRVAGDVMDILYLCSAMKSEDANPARLAAALASVMGVTAMDIMASLELSRDPRTATGLLHDVNSMHPALQRHHQQPPQSSDFSNRGSLPQPVHAY